MTTWKKTGCAALVVAAGFLVATVRANGEKSGPPPKTSTGRELTGPGAHHEEYLNPTDTMRVRTTTVPGRIDTSLVVDTVYKPKPKPRPQPNPARSGGGVPTPGVDDKSSTRPGE